MPSIDRPLSGDVLLFDLAKERERSVETPGLLASGRSARTLLKHGRLRVILVTLAAGGELAEHQADGPITLQPLDGTIRFTTHDRSYDVAPGEMLSAGPGVRHSVSTRKGASFLLTIATADDGTADARALG